MFRFMQEPSSGSSPVFRSNYQYGLSVLVGIEAVNVMAAYQPVVHIFLKFFTAMSKSRAKKLIL